MRIEADRAELLAAVAAAAPYAGVAGLHLGAGPAGVGVTARGPDGGCVVAVPCGAAAVHRAGEAVTPAGPLHRILRGSGGDAVDLDLRPGAGRLVVRTADGRFELPSGDPAAYPHPELPPGDAAEVRFDAGDFRRAASRVWWAALGRGPKEGEPPPPWQLYGVRLAARGGTLELAATDTYRMAASPVRLADAAPAPAAEKVHRRTVRLWADAAGRYGGGCRLSLWGSGAAFACGPVAAWAPVLAGPFPDAAPLVAAGPHALAVPPAEFLAAAELALVAAEEDDGTPVTLRAVPGRLAVESAGGESAARVEVAADYAGPPAGLRVGGWHLVQFLRAVADEPSVSVSWGGGPHPVLAAGGSRYVLCLRAEGVT